MSEVVQADRDAAAKALGYQDWEDATDYRLTGHQDRTVTAMAEAFARHRQASTDDLVEALGAALPYLESHLRGIEAVDRTVLGHAGGNVSLNDAIDRARTALTKAGAL